MNALAQAQREEKAWWETVADIAKSDTCPKCKSHNIKKRYTNNEYKSSFDTYCADCNYELISILD